MIDTQTSVVKMEITKISPFGKIYVEDLLAIEEPLEIRLAYGPFENRTTANISVTMRTPGADEELAVGFLFTEGIITSVSDLKGVNHQFIACREDKQNTIVVELQEDAIPHLPTHERSFYTTSSCGVCGKGSIEAIRTVSFHQVNQKASIKLASKILSALPEKLRAQQQVFDQTGGLHACALFDTNGEIMLMREDVGRHNALDKIIGAGLANTNLSMGETVLLLSGRASFELIQKSVMAGIQIVAAVGAPSSLAVSLAAEFDITLIGFLKKDRFNIYNAPERIIIEHYENKN